MNLLIDVGNTWTKWCFDQGNEIRVSQFSSMESSLAYLQEIQQEAVNEPVEQILISCVKNSDALNELIENCTQVFGVQPKNILPQAYFAGFSNGYTEPEKLGVDRWLAMLGAYHRLNSAFILISMGTAITVDLVDHGGIHRGGYITPGIQLLYDALLSGTDSVRPQLHPLTSDSAKLGKTTQEAVMGGIAGMIKGVIYQAVQHYAGEASESIKKVVTGGQSNQLAVIDKDVIVINNLVLEGLKVVAMYTSRRAN